MGKIVKNENIGQVFEFPWLDFLKAEKHGDIEAQNYALNRMQGDPRIEKLFEDCEEFYSKPLKRHNDAAHPLHELGLLIDFGFDYDNLRMKKILDSIVDKITEEGYFPILIEIPQAFSKKKFGVFESWILCDFPNLLYYLIKAGLKEDKKVRKAVLNLEKLSDSNGWRCKGDIEGFRGPGKKDDFCPYANLISLKVFSLLSEYHEREFIRNAIDAFYSHWENQKEKKYYMFGIGTDFRKLKYPNVWFDILHVCRVLKSFEYARKNPVYSEMLEIIDKKRQQDGFFKAESVYRVYKEFDFGQKKCVSPTLTYFIEELLYKD